jgi:hypothetical protein
MANHSKDLTDKELDEIETMAGLGLRFEDIAAVKGMSDDTLKKYAADRLQRGRAKAKTQVMQTAYKMAVSGKQPAMTMFWLKTRACWRENQQENSLNKEQAALIDAMRASSTPTQHLVNYLATTIEQVARGELDPSVAASIAAMSNTLMKASSQGNVEERLAELEELLKAQKPQPLDLDL